MDGMLLKKGMTKILNWRAFTLWNHHKTKEDIDVLSFLLRRPQLSWNEMEIQSGMNAFFLDIAVKELYNIGMKTKLTFLLDKELHDFVKQYAKQNHKSVTKVLVDFIFDLQKKEKQSAKNI
jgi:hypothetical protein